MQTTVNKGFERDTTDCRECVACSEVILTDMYRLAIEVMGERIVSDKFVYCESCYLEMIK